MRNLMDKGRRWPLALLILLGWGGAEAAGPAFPHAKHFQPARCSTCHVRDEGGELKPVEIATCRAQGCHTEAVSLRPSTFQRKLVVDYPHGLPAHMKVEFCTECHASTDDTPRPGDARFNTETCFGCHDDVRWGMECKPCHPADQAKKKPPWHDSGWRDGHGARVGTPEFDRHDRRCVQCHDLGLDDPKRQSFCKDCHQQKKPLYHRRHLEDRGARCESCHPRPEQRDWPTPSKEACAACHTGPVQTERIITPARKLRVDFPHLTHVGEVECVTCHRRTIEDTQPAGEPVLTQPECMGCHQSLAVGVPERACARCHGVHKDEIRPADHRENWTIRHGIEAETRSLKGHGQDCSLCHGASPCDRCHRTIQPRSHTALWRDRTHGLAASWDRESCQICHETGTCVACHRSTRPINHRGAWEDIHGVAAVSKSNNRCAACHQPSWCTACHLRNRR